MEEQERQPLDGLSRAHTCGACGHTWAGPVTLSEHTANLSGEITPWCPKCGAWAAFSSEPFPTWKTPLFLFTTRAGLSYVVSWAGEICQEQYYRGPHSFSGQWRLIGARSTYNARRLTFTLSQVLACPAALLGTWLVDYDHGITRYWVGDGPVRAVDCEPEIFKGERLYRAVQK
jgi:hypothetical protein